MKTIGIDEDNFLVYEGNNHWGHGVWPTPVILPMNITDESKKDIAPAHKTGLSHFPYIFIDEGYDPTSRVRRGRVYEKSRQQPMQWHVHAHPATGHKQNPVNSREEVQPKSLHTFQQCYLKPELKRLEIEYPIVTLGSSEQFTIWSIVDVETTISRETILYLKERKVIGALPRVNYSAFDSTLEESVKDKIDRLSEDLYRAGPDSIVDRAREAASAICNAYLLQNDFIEKEKDLGQLQSYLVKAERVVAANCVSTLAKLHSRTKHNEQSTRDLRRVNETDAEYAVQSIAMLLLELGYVVGG